MNHSAGAAHCPRRKARTHHQRRNYEPPSSPFLQWKLDDDKTTGVADTSARKLAAGLWQLRFTEISRSQHLHFISRPSDPSVGHPQLELSLPYPKCASERVKKSDTVCSDEYDDVYNFYSNMKLLKDSQATTGSIVSTLNAELTQARLCIRELEAERQSFKKQVKHFLRKLEEQRVSWQSKARQENHAIEELKEELGRDRKSRQQMENVNTYLIRQLAGAKMSAEKFMKKYEEERKSRKLMEEISNELAEQIREEKAKVGALKRNSMKILEEVEEERKMLHAAEVWREERVQMKLIDAKLALEDKYCQLNKLMTDVETFLRSRFGTLDMMELRQAELILQEVKSLNINDIEGLSYVPPESNDIFSVFEELRQCEGNERETEPCHCHTPSSHDSKVHPLSPENNGLNKTPIQTHLNCLNDYNSCSQEDTRCLDNISHAKDQGSCDSLEGGKPSINSVSQIKNASRCRSEGNENAGQYSPDRETNEVFAVSEKQSEHKTSSASKLWRSCSSKGEFYKIVLDESERRLSNGITSSRGKHAHRGLFEHETRHKVSVGRCIPTDIANPHIIRGMKGCIEWPRAIQKNGSKAMLLEAKIESQKSQLRHVLKQKPR